MKLSNLYPWRDRYAPNPPATVPLQGHSKVTMGRHIGAVVRDGARALKAHGATDPTVPLPPFQEPDQRSELASSFVTLGADKTRPAFARRTVPYARPVPCAARRWFEGVPRAGGHPRLIPELIKPES